MIIAETGADMTRFPTAGHLASWAGTTPGSNESAGRVKSTKTRPGNPYLQGPLGAAAMSLAKSPNTYLGTRYRHIATRRGPMKANVAIQHNLLTIIWHMATTSTLYEDPEADYIPNTPRTAHSTNSKRWATRSLSTASGNSSSPCHEGESSCQRHVGGAGGARTHDPRSRSGAAHRRSATALLRLKAHG
ncbi:transposase [Aeromicrobium sp.]|uniref:transposase n=1 Tax=Aeromicrobium sp. TaxID=1871063 RepID=UPI0025BD97C0|nr:transposase [Aeromicrobium sp.]